MINDKLYDYQSKAVDFVMEREGAAIFCEQGTGKTYISTGLIERLVHSKFIGLLVVPLANIETTWVKTLGLVAGVRICRNLQDFREHKKSGATILLINYERVRPIIKKIRKIEWDLILYDESQRLKGRGSKQSRDAARFVYGHRRVILSGTPIEQSPQDLWAQFRFAVPRVFGTRFDDFKGKWLKETGFMGYELKFRDELLPQFLAIIEPHIMRVRKDEVLDLPPLTYKRVGVDLLGEQARVYEELRDHMMTTVGPHEITCDLAITQLIRLQQVTGGFVTADPTEDERRQAALSNRKVRGQLVLLGRAKLRKLKVLLNRLEAPVVIFCKYRQELAQIVETCGSRRVGIVSGKLKKQRTATVQAFQRGEYDVLVCQIKAGGVGLDLQNAFNAIIYSPTFSFIDFDQAVCRLHRIGQLRTVCVYLLFAKNTVDDDIYTALLSKRKVTETILRRRHMAKAAVKTKTAPVETKKVAPAKAPAAKEEAPAEEKEAAPAFKYGVKDLAEALGTQPASVRVRLRNANVAKAGKSYGWNSKAELQEVIAAIKTEKKSAAAEEETEEEETEEEE